MIEKKSSHDWVFYTGILALLLIALGYMMFFSTLNVKGTISGEGNLTIPDLVPYYDGNNMSLNMDKLDIEFEAEIPLVLLYQVRNPFQYIPSIW